MIFSFDARVVLTLEHTEGQKTSNHVSTDFNLEVSENIDKNKYLEMDLPNAEGSKVMTNVLVQGLISNIHFAHQKGYKNDAEHLRQIITMLEDGFIRIANVHESKFKM